MPTTPDRRYARLVGAAVHLPAELVSAEDTERGLRADNPGLGIPDGLITRLSGVRYRHRLPDRWQPSDLAVAAAIDVLARTGAKITDIDLLIYAAASADVLEPATAHIVADKLSAQCPVFDVKNACNSVVNGIEIADAMIRAGRYRTILVASGEAPTRAPRKPITSLAEFIEAFPAYTLSDAGAALLFQHDTEPGVLNCRFTANSAAWPAAVLPYSGLPEPAYLSISGRALRKALRDIDIDSIVKGMTGPGYGLDDFAVFFVHQPSIRFFQLVCQAIGIPADKVVPIVAAHGNTASVGLVLQLVEALETGRVGTGDLVALIGLASGLSAGVVVLRL